MSSDLLKIFFQFVFVLLLLALVMAGVDSYFTVSTPFDFFSIFKMNVFFTLGSGVIMLLVFLIILSNETSALKIFRNDAAIIRFGLFVSFVLMYFLKKYFITRYGIIFSFPNVIVLAELALMMVIPFMAGHYVKEFGKAFAH